MKRTIIFLAACAPGVPDEPSYQQHVAPILAANCVRCHGIPVLGGAPPGFRLDSYTSYERPMRNAVGIETVAGAATFSNIIAMRIVSSDAPMPPRFGLDDYQIEILQAWDAAGAPRGEPNEGNRVPTAALVGTRQSIEEQGIEIRVRYLIDVTVGDPDNDVVGGALRARLGATVLPLGLLRSGENRVVWETTNIAPGTFSLEAVLDDGGVESTVDLGALVVEAP
ncbi:MAG: hypothetical protein M4D80_38920 [Myxococcota bacterium]|nr:hypothetical protein [Deltaproteobacteria bacterium]MDQ3341164.1 hypothetical protein [Myxococcota bacterium]